jgi:hypothetical protein
MENEGLSDKDTYTIEDEEYGREEGRQSNKRNRTTIERDSDINFTENQPSETIVTENIDKGKGKTNETTSPIEPQQRAQSPDNFQDASSDAYMTETDNTNREVDLSIEASIHNPNKEIVNQEANKEINTRKEIIDNKGTNEDKHKVLRIDHNIYGKVTLHCIFVELIKIDGYDNMHKKERLSKFFSQERSFEDNEIKTIDGKEFIITKFRNEKARDDYVSKMIPKEIAAEEGMFRAFDDIEDIYNYLDENDRSDIERSIKIENIPSSISEEEMKNFFTIQLKMKIDHIEKDHKYKNNRPAWSYSLFITLKNRRDYNILVQGNESRGSIRVKGRDLRLFPIDLPDNEKNTLNKNVFKITGLKENTVVDEIDKLKETLNANAIIIPEHVNDKGVVRKDNFGLVYVNEEDIINEKLEIRFKDHTVYAMPLNVKHCGFCGHWDHVNYQCKNRSKNERRTFNSNSYRNSLSADSKRFINIRKNKGFHDYRHRDNYPTYENNRAYEQQHEPTYNRKAHIAEQEIQHDNDSYYHNRPRYYQNTNRRGRGRTTATNHNKAAEEIKQILNRPWNKVVSEGSQKEANHNNIQNKTGPNTIDISPENNKLTNTQITSIASSSKTESQTQAPIYIENTVDKISNEQAIDKNDTINNVIEELRYNTNTNNIEITNRTEIEQNSGNIHELTNSATWPKVIDDEQF